jgi:hypothetical protein
VVDISKTRDELILEAAIRLNIVGTGQELEVEYADRIDANFDPLMMQLAADGVCNVVNDQDIPVQWFDGLAGLLANVSAAVAGKGFDPGIKQYYEMQLRRLTGGGPSYAVLESEYF